jgi:GntR family transcriptional regulator
MENWKTLLKIDSRLKIPLYHQIVQNITDLIEEGKLAQGSMLPSEWELTNLYSVSRLTVRQALKDLEQNGLVTRRHGIGTFVSTPPTTQLTPSKMSFSQKMRQIGKKPSNRILSIERIAASREVANMLQLPEKALVIELVRVRFADEEPIMIETAYLPAERFPDLTEDNLSEGSLYQFLSEHYSISIAAVDQTLQPVLVKPRQATLLDVESGSPAILTKVIAYSRNNVPVEYSWSITGGDKCKFYFHFREEETVAA